MTIKDKAQEIARIPDKTLADLIEINGQWDYCAEEADNIDVATVSALLELQELRRKVGEEGIGA